jgi:murein DD-endopeptidase MepM/ murein hydrolase activator NlpD
VVGEPGSRTIVQGAGATAREASVEWQVGDDPAAANQYGWNCRVHVEYEGTPAVDWYVSVGTPVYATMDGTATLYVNTIANAFDYYGVSREPYIGNPDRTRAPIAPFPGLSGGMGVWVSVESATHRTDYGHLDFERTLVAAPPDVFFGDADWRARIAAPRTAPEVGARWRVRRGDIIGYTGDAGYSEAPHLHYQIIRLSDGAQLCPTGEAGYADGGWLEK